VKNQGVVEAGWIKQSILQETGVECRISCDSGFLSGVICAIWVVGSSALGDAVARPRDDRQKDLLRPALEAIIDLGHPLVRLGREIDWGFVDQRFSSVCVPGPEPPGLPTRLVAGLFILKHMHNLSDEVLCARWVENPYYQFFCGELSFCHKLPFDRSSLTHWRQRLGEEQLMALIQESLSVAHKTGALATKDLERVAVDTTVQPKAIAHPTDARLCHCAIEKLTELARRNAVPLRQSYRRVAKRAAIMVGRYTHAHQFKRARRALKFLRIRLGRVIRDIRRKIDGDETLKERFTDLLALAVRVRFQDHRQRGPKVYALDATEVECTGKGKARAPYEFGCKVSVAIPATKPKGGQFVLHAKALHGNPFDGHTLGPVVTELEKLTGVETRRIHVDKGYRGHNHAEKFRVWITGQVRVTAPIRREIKRRAAVEPVIGRRRLQLRPPLALAGKAFARPYRGILSSSAEPPIPLKTVQLQFFTDDSDVSAFRAALRPQSGTRCFGPRLCTAGQAIVCSCQLFVPEPLRLRITPPCNSPLAASGMIGNERPRAFRRAARKVLGAVVGAPSHSRKTSSARRSGSASFSDIVRKVPEKASGR
jgi:transposase, IS5 family